MRGTKVEMSGLSLQQQAKIIADRSKIDTFISSLGYLDRFKRRSGISLKHFCGNAGSVDNGNVTEWFAKRPEIHHSRLPLQYYTTKHG